MFKTYLKAIFLSIFCALNASAAHSVSLLRDPDIEYGLQQLAEPILRAANLNSECEGLDRQRHGIECFYH